MTGIEQENERLKAALQALVTAAKVPASLYSGHYEIPIRQYMNLQQATREAEQVLASVNAQDGVDVEGVAI